MREERIRAIRETAIIAVNPELVPDLTGMTPTEVYMTLMRRMGIAARGGSPLEALLNPKHPLFGTRLAEVAREAWEIKAAVYGDSKMAAIIAIARQIAAELLDTSRLGARTEGVYG